MSVLLRKVPLQKLEKIQASLAEKPDEALDKMLILLEPGFDELPIRWEDSEVYEMLLDWFQDEASPALLSGGRFRPLLDFLEDSVDVAELHILCPDDLEKVRAYIADLDFDIPGFIEDFAYNYDLDERGVSAALQTLMGAIMASTGEALLFVGR